MGIAIPFSIFTSNLDRLEHVWAVATYAAAQAPLQPTVGGRKLEASTGGEAGINLSRIMVPAEPFSEPLTTIVATFAGIATRVNGRSTRSADRHISEAIPW